MGSRMNPIAREAERFFVKVREEGDCWIWKAARDKDGYGRFGKNPTLRYYPAHQWSWEYFTRKGRVPAGFEIDHLCHNRACVHPMHLEVVTHAENMRRKTFRGVI